MGSSKPLTWSIAAAAVALPIALANPTAVRSCGGGGGNSNLSRPDNTDTLPEAKPNDPLENEPLPGLDDEEEGAGQEAATEEPAKQDAKAGSAEDKPEGFSPAEVTVEDDPELGAALRNDSDSKSKNKSRARITYTPRFFIRYPDPAEDTSQEEPSTSEKSLDERYIETAVKKALEDVLGDLEGHNFDDLEERVAELEATTVRRGRGRIPMTISGRVNRAVREWGDGADPSEGEDRPSIQGELHQSADGMQFYLRIPVVIE